MALCLAQIDSTIRQSTASVVACSPAASAAADKDRDRDRDRDQHCGSYLVVLDDTCLYPGGGGQPCDTGIVGGRRCSETLMQVFRRQEDGALVHVLDGPLDVDSQVAVQVDWDRRLDLMQQHSAQHLVSGVAEQVLGAPTVSWELGNDTVCVDLDVKEELRNADGLIDGDIVTSIEDKVNTEIRNARRIFDTIFDLTSQQDIEQIDSLPESIRNEMKMEKIGNLLRVVEIDGVDVTPCGGSHLTNTAEMQLVKIVSVVKDRGSVRLVFIAGNRVMARLTESLVSQMALSKLLSCRALDFSSRVDKLLSEKRDFAKSNKLLQEEVACFLGKSRAEQVASDERLIVISRPGVDIPFLAKAISTASETRPRAVIFAWTNNQAETGGGGAQKQSADQEKRGMFIIQGPPQVVNILDLKPILSAIDGKGGGKNGKVQGKATNMSEKSALQVESLLREQLAVADEE